MEIFFFKLWEMQTKIHKNTIRYRKIFCCSVFRSACSDYGTKVLFRSGTGNVPLFEKLFRTTGFLVLFRHALNKTWQNLLKNIQWTLTGKYRHRSMIFILPTPKKIAIDWYLERKSRNPEVDGFSEFFLQQF